MCEWSIQTAIDSLVTQLNGPRHEAWFKLSGEFFAVEYLSDKWARIMRGCKADGGGNRSVYAFIALQDYETKTLGKVIRGGIYKPASFKIAAKHARGSVFAADNGFSCCGEYGVTYLK